MKNFRVDVAMQTRTNKSAGNSDAVIVAEYQTNHILALSEWLGSAMEYYKGAVLFDSDVLYVTMLVRCYKDHHTITISPSENSEGLVIQTNM